MLIVRYKFIRTYDSPLSIVDCVYAVYWTVLARDARVVSTFGVEIIILFFAIIAK